MIWLLLALWLVGFLLLWRVPPFRKQVDSNEPATLSLIIPARNEEQNIGHLLQSIKGCQDLGIEVIVVDDDSSDATSAVAHAHGAKVIRAPQLPDKWRGKTWACHHGAKVAQGDWLLFLDADLIFKADALSRILNLCQSGKWDALSLGPYHEVKKPYEQLSAVFNLLTFMGMGAFSMTGSPERPKAMFGPFLLISKRKYQEAGGHEAVKEEILEHMSLAKILQQKGARILCLGGKGTVHIRMYPDGLATLIEGWAKAFSTGAAKTDPVILWLSVLWITGGMTAALLSGFSLFLVPFSAWLWISYFAYAIQLAIMLRQIGNFSILSCLLYPVLFVGFMYIFAKSLLIKKSGKQVTWKGRSFKAADQNDG